MTYHNYEIPENISKEDEFMYNLVERLYGVHSHNGFVMGEFLTLITHMKENSVSDSIVQEAEEVFQTFELYLKEHNEVYDFICDRWKELGKPLSLEAHQKKKEELDAQDEYRAEYCDR